MNTIQNAIEILNEARYDLQQRYERGEITSAYWFFMNTKYEAVLRDLRSILDDIKGNGDDSRGN